MKEINILQWLKGQKINKPMIPIKSFGFFLNFGKQNVRFNSVKRCFLSFFSGGNMIFPYLTLQMFNIGLGFSDVSIISGITQFLTVFASPLAGNFV